MSDGANTGHLPPEFVEATPLKVAIKIVKDDLFRKAILPVHLNGDVGGGSGIFDI